MCNHTRHPLPYAPSISADLVVAALAGVDGLDRGGLDRLRGRHVLGDGVERGGGLARLRDGLLVRGCASAGCPRGTRRGRLTGEGNVGVPGLRGGAGRSGRNGLGNRGRDAVSELLLELLWRRQDSLGGGCALPGSHSGRARQAARSRLGLSTAVSSTAEVPLLRLSKREAASQSLSVGDPLLGDGGCGGDRGDLGRSGVGLESSVVLALGARLQGLGARRGRRLGGSVGGDGRGGDGLRLGGGDFGDPSPNSCHQLLIISKLTARLTLGQDTVDLGGAVGDGGRAGEDGLGRCGLGLGAAGQRGGDLGGLSTYYR